MGRAMKLTPTAKAQVGNLVDQMKKGNAAAFGEFIEITQNSVFRFCFYLSKNREQADEICQETFLKAMINIGTLSKEYSALDWLLRIAKNLFIDEFRRTKRQTELLNDNFESTHVPTSSTEAAFEVRQILSHFEPDDRTLLILIDLENYSYLEAATVLGVSEDAVRSRIHRARQVFVNYMKAGETK